jgi:hypothetical protein
MRHNWNYSEKEPALDVRVLVREHALTQPTQAIKKSLL